MTVGLLVASCAEPEDGTDMMMMQEEEMDDEEFTDVRVPIPEEDANHYNFVAQELMVAPGEERTTCFHMRVPHDMALSNIDMLQGEYGHHAVVVSSNEPLPDGTIEDCTDETTYAKFKALLIPVADPPQGAAYWLEAGTPVVLQSHYVNASDKPILTRDVVRGEVVPTEDVTDWMAPFTATALGFEVPSSDEPTELTFDCVLDRNVDLLYVGGHMHEWGTQFEIELGAAEDTLESIYSVEGWVPDFRDLPPIEIYADNPLRITQGAILRTSCQWENRTGASLTFPQEMCVSFGVLRGSKEAYDCRSNP
jgi:hypothetical protein